MTESQENLPKLKRFGLDAKTGDLLLWKYRIAMPKTALARIILGVLLILGGIFSFLPVLGVWMLPLGLIVLSQDIPQVRRLRRRFSVWWEKRGQRKQAEGESETGKD